MRTPQEIDDFDPTDALDCVKGFFLVGIGGAGMSGLARLLRSRGTQVLGTDSTDSPLVRELISLGIPVRIGHSGADIHPGDAVVFSDAIDLKTSPEAERAAELGSPIFRRSQVLGWLMRGRKVIAVTGTHGKTSTSGMIASGLRAAGLDPTIVIGAPMPGLGTGVIEGTSDWAVVEACEAYESYRDIDPTVTVLTSLEPDHLDYHKTWERLLASMQTFLAKTPQDGLILASTDSGAQEATDGSTAPIKTYSPNDLPDITLQVPGIHSRENAAGALAACVFAGADPAKAAEGIAAFKGADRRLQVIRDEDIAVVDDYAHHPTEIRASIQAMREQFPGRRVCVVFQPHLYSRTEHLLKEFAAALSEADHVVLTDIYPAREEPKPGVSSLRVGELITAPLTYVPSRHLLPRTAAGLAKEGDVWIGMGAGNISEFAPAFLEELDRPSRARIAVICGGDSAEREVSIHSGREVKAALDRLGYDAFLLDITEKVLSSGDLSALIGPNRPDAVILEVHGTTAEDGAIQGLLQVLHIPYSGSGVGASSACMDKQATKDRMAADGLPVPFGVYVMKGDDLSIAPHMPVVVKPNSQGSTVGLTFVESVEDLQAAVDKALQYDSIAIIEERVDGMEISVPVMGDRALPPVEIVPASGEYDFEAKYVPGATEEICPARLSEETLEEVEALALYAHKLMGCSGVTRTDMIVTKTGPVILEINTIPGMTSTSLVPTSAEAAGISFDELVRWTAEDALQSAHKA